MTTLPLDIRFDRDGLVPVVTQDAATSDVLMLAFMNEESLRRTLETGQVHYWSRSRNALWLKGETSGNRQQLISIHVNCDQNSLLVKVLQEGAVCHDGYDTCFYRSLGGDGMFHVERDRVFDPESIYGQESIADVPGAEAIRLQFEAYEYLRDNDLSAMSSTSRQLRTPNIATLTRVGDELRELAAVLTGEHVHQDKRNDVILESSQIIYWVYVTVIGAKLTWSLIRPDVALAAHAEGASDVVLNTLLGQFSERWMVAPDQELGIGALAHATLSLVAYVCRSEDIDPLEAVQYDVRELQTRSYLNTYFENRPDATPAG